MEMPPLDAGSGVPVDSGAPDSGLPDTPDSGAPLPLNRPPVGALEISTSGRLLGWARDEDFAGPIAVELYGDDGGGGPLTLLGTVVANLPREPAVGAHGFDFEYYAPQGVSRIHAFGVNVDATGAVAGDKAALAGVPKALELPPAGYDSTCWVPLETLWRTRIGATDWMSTTSRSERKAGTAHDGQLCYLYKDPFPGSGRLNRLVAGGDHMDSTGDSEGPYQAEGPLGHLFTYPFPELVSVSRRFNASTGDHLTGTTADLPTPAGYAEPAYFGRYCYPRFNRQATAFSTVTHGATRVESNRVAGGAVWHWFYKGVQYINTYDYGRLMQATLFYDTSKRPGGGCNVSGNPYVNPTEAGDGTSGCHSLESADWFGSPLKSDTLSADGLTHSTRAIPIDFNPPLAGCDAPNYPRLFKDMVLGKDLTLGFNGWDNVSRYVTVVTLPKPIPGSDLVALEMPTAYTAGSFNQFYTVDLSASTGKATATRQVPDANGFMPNFHPASGYGGVLVADGTADTANAFGLFSTIGTNNSGAWAQDLVLYSVIDPKGPNGPTDNNTGKLGVVRYPKEVPGGTSRYVAWVVTGTRAEVASRMEALYAYCQTHGQLGCQ